jgi:hypothetical protein
MVRKLTCLLMEGHRRHLYYDHIAEFLIANDVVPVVRCKDCKHRKKWTTTGQFCCFHETSGMAVGVDLRDDDFCSYGERKDDA